jgi:hypothetical protein
MSSFTSSFTTSIAKQPTLCPILWSASLKTHSHRVKHMVKLQKHGSLLRSWSCSWSCFLKIQLYRWSWAVPNGPYISTVNITSWHWRKPHSILTLLRTWGYKCISLSRKKIKNSMQKIDQCPNSLKKEILPTSKLHKWQCGTWPLETRFWGL